MNRYLRCYAEISLEAIGHNIREVKKRLPEGVKLLGVVKANAYGHGAVPVASYLENQVDYFATATIEEAVELRENGISAPILILGYVSPSQYGDLVEYDITQTIDSYAQALALEKEAARQNRKAKAHLAVVPRRSAPSPSRRWRKPEGSCARIKAFIFGKAAEMK